jgi:hypothetical protein
MPGLHHGMAGVQYANSAVEKARAVNRAVFNHFKENPVLVSTAVVPKAVRQKHQEFLDRVLRNHRALGLPR